MNLNLPDASVLASSIYKNTQKYNNVDVVIAPPSVYIYPLVQSIKSKRQNFALAAQNIMYLDSGEYTGEISARMIKNACNYVIIGHSERRKHFGETDEIVVAKVKSALSNNLKVIVCFGEAERYHLEDHFDYEVKRMKSKEGMISSISKVLAVLDDSDFSKLVIAYEPIWAIGTSNAASGAYAAAISYIIKDHLKDKFGDRTSEIKFLYGGSVCPENAEDFLCQPDIDGLLVGGASLKSKDFVAICKLASEIKSVKN
jgi:triosephosphate isomerase